MSPGISIAGDGTRRIHRAHHDRSYRNRISPQEEQNLLRGINDDAPGSGRQQLKLYTIIDVFFRQVMGRRVEQVEDSALAQELSRNAVLATMAKATP